MSENDLHIAFYDQRNGVLTLAMKCPCCGKTYTIKACPGCVEKLKALVRA
jgi:hypothetical protein